MACFRSIFIALRPIILRPSFISLLHRWQTLSCTTKYKWHFETLTKHINQYSTMQAIFIWTEYYIRRNLPLKNKSQVFATLIMRTNGKHCLHSIFITFHFVRCPKYLTPSLPHFWQPVKTTIIFSKLAISKNDNLFFTHRIETLHP